MFLFQVLQDVTRVSTFSYVMWTHIFPRKTRDFVNQFLPVQGLLSS